ncbi:MAG: restriction endonuclease subunit S, partial [Candidatus Thorarchaeota archaeon]
ANKPYLDLVANGSTYPELYIGDLFEFEISVPPLNVQDKIVNAIKALQYVSTIGLPLEQSVG